MHVCVCVWGGTRARMYVPSLAPLSFILRDFLKRPTGSSAPFPPDSRAFAPPSLTTPPHLPPLFEDTRNGLTKVAAASLYPEILQLYTDGGKKEKQTAKITKPWAAAVPDVFSTRLFECFVFFLRKEKKQKDVLDMKEQRPPEVEDYAAYTVLLFTANFSINV